MAHESKSGANAKVTIDGNFILGIGNWEIAGGSVEQLDNGEFGNKFTKMMAGIIDAGTISFSGLYKADDTQGQERLKEAFWSQEEVTTLKFWIDNTSGYITNNTTAVGGGLPADMPISHIKIVKEPGVSMERAGLGKVTFEGVVSGGPMRLE